MLTWISEQAKWIVYTFIVFIVVGLLFMDLSQISTNNVPEVGKVDGVKIDNDQFDMQLRRVQAQYRDQGQELKDKELSDLRKNLFESLVQRVVVQKEMAKLDLRASTHEMLSDLKRDPPEGVVRSPLFMGPDSQFDPAKWLSFIATDSVWDDPQMLQMEASLRDDKVPFKQLQLFVEAGAHMTDLEAKFQVLRRENKAKFTIAKLWLDSIPAVDSISEEQISQYFEANPDSFVVKEDMAKLAFVALPIKASEADDKATLEYANMILSQIKDGGDFAELAVMNSEDPGSAKTGGRMGPTPKGRWVKPFEEAAFALDSGDLSQPVRSQFGYHIILSHGRTMVDSVEMADVSHILLKVSPSPETVDSLTNTAKQIKDRLEEGATIDVVASEFSVQVDTSGYVGRSNLNIGVGFLRGLAYYAFGEKRGDQEKASAVLQNDQFVVVAQMVNQLSAGSIALEPFKEQTIATLKKEQRLQTATEMLNALVQKLPDIMADSAQRAAHKIQLDSTAFIGADSYIPGLGYAVPQLAVAFAQQKGQWGGVLQGDRAVMSLQLVGTQSYNLGEVDQKIIQEFNASASLQSAQLVNKWIEQRVESAEVTNNLDLFFQE